MIPMKSRAGHRFTQELRDLAPKPASLREAVIAAAAGKGIPPEFFLLSRHPVQVSCWASLG